LPIVWNLAKKLVALRHTIWAYVGGSQKMGVDAQSSLSCRGHV